MKTSPSIIIITINLVYVPSVSKQHLQSKRI
jgi:hypothetical protein